MSQFRRRGRHHPSTRRLTRRLSVPVSGVSSAVGVSNHRVSMSTPFIRNRSGSLLSILIGSSSPVTSRALVGRSLGGRVRHALRSILNRHRHSVVGVFFKVNVRRVALRRVNSGFKLAHRHIQRVGWGTVHHLESGAGDGLLGICLKWGQSNGNCAGSVVQWRQVRLKEMLPGARCSSLFRGGV